MGNIINVISEQLPNGSVLEIATLLYGAYIVVHIKHGEAIIFPTLCNFLNYEDGIQVKRKYCSEDELEEIYETWPDYESIPIEETI